MRIFLRAHRALAAACVTLIGAWIGLIAAHTPTAPVVPERLALHDALTSPVAGPLLHRIRWTRLEVTPQDARYELLGFYRGGRLLALVTVRRGGEVPAAGIDDLSATRYLYGSDIAHDPLVLGLLCLVFVVMTGVWPLWRLRNLDVVAAVSSVGAIVSLDRLTLGRVVLVSYPLMGYFASRCAWVALGPSTRPCRPSTALYDVLTARWSIAQRVRLLRLIALSSALVVVMVGLSSMHVIDVGYALMEGATAITHGLLPYGHIADVFHGDTYPIGSYLLYVPLAWLSPVRDELDNADLTLVVAAIAALFVAWALERVLRAASTPAERAGAIAGNEPGLRAAIAWMTFPPLLVAVSTGTSDVALAAMLLGALWLWRRPASGAMLLMLAVWFKAAPLVLLPPWLARLHGRALARSLIGVAAVSAAMVATLFALGGSGAFARMLHAMGFQLARRSPHTLWTFVGGVPLEQLAQAGTLALIVGATLQIRRDPALASSRRRLAALSCAILLALQVSANYWSYMYLVWVFPLIALGLGSAHRPHAAGR